MNRSLLYISLIVIFAQLGCDTKDNVKPRNENFFVKTYDGILPGDQFGNDIIETSDGGLLIAGTAVNTDGTEEMLLIKTDAKGDKVWTLGSVASLNWTTNGRSKSVLELPDGSGYILGGTLGSGNQRRSVLLKVDPSGAFIDSTMLKTKTASQEFYNQLSKVTFTHDYIVVSGETGLIESGVGDGINGFVGILNLDFSLANDGPIGPSSFKARYFGLPGDEIITGAYEVYDTLQYGANGTRYFAFGSSQNPNNGSIYDLFAIELDRNLTITSQIESGFKSITGTPGNQIPHFIDRLEDDYVVIGETDVLGLQTYLDAWKNTGWSNVFSGVVGNTVDVRGKSVAVKGTNEFVIVGDYIESLNVHHEIFLAKVDAFQFVDTPWPKQFGTTTSTYSSSSVRVLQDKSIVIVGTADLDPIMKIVVIKTGPNGEMSF